jgi:6-phosphogluconolactonase
MAKTSNRYQSGRGAGTMASQLVFVGSYAESNQPGIHVFGFDPDSGALEPRAAHAGIANPSFLVVHPNGCLYAVSELGEAGTGRSGSICALRFEAKNGALKLVNRQSSGGGAPCHLVLDGSGDWVVVSNYNSGTVCVLPIADDGSLGAPTHLVRHHGQGTNLKRQAGPHAHSATFAPDGRFVLVADLGIDEIVVYAFDADAGRLAAQASARARPGAGPRHLSFHPGRHVLYVANELDNTIAVYAYDAATGRMQERQSLSTLPPGAPASKVADIHITPSGTHAYVSNRGHDSIAVFDIAADGTLALAAIQPSGGRGPRHFALAPSGRFMLTANEASGDVVVLPILETSAGLGDAVARATVAGASCVQFVPSP